MSADEAAAPEGDEREFSYETFGRRFFEYAVTTERVESALASIATAIPWTRRCDMFRIPCS